MKKIAIFGVAMILIATMAFAAPNEKARSKDNHLALVTKNPTDWTVVPGPWGKLNYDEYFVFNGHGLPEGEYTLITYIGWPNVRCIASGEVEDDGNIHLAGVTGQLYSDQAPQIPVKVWLIPSADVDCTNGMFLAWNPTTYLFEN